MSLNESHVEEATLEWFGELGYAVGHLSAPRSATRQAGGPQIAPAEYAGGTLTPALSQGERESYGEVVQSRVARTLTQPLPAGEEKREAIRRLNPAATVKEYLSVQTKKPTS